MNVLHLDSALTWRGGQRQALLLATGLERRGVTSTVAAPRGAELRLRAEAAGLATRPLRMRGDLDALGALGVARAARAAAADVVHAHDARAHAVARLARGVGLRAPLVVTRRSVPAKRTGWATRMKYRSGVARYIAVSEAVRGGLIGLGVDPDRVTVVHSGVDLGQHPPEAAPWRERLGIGADLPVVGSVGSLSGEKGFDTLIAALALMACPAHVVIAGAGADEAKLERAARQAGVAERVHLPGFVTDPRAAIAGFDLYVQPSRMEGLGSSVIDALALGVPVVVSRAGGLTETVEHGRSGLLVPPGDSLALANALDQLIVDAALRERLAAAGPERARRFSAEAMVDGTLAVYRAVLEGS